MTPLLNSEAPARNPRQERRLVHDGTRYTVSLGCTTCPERDVCGGLQIERALFDCLGFCCNNPETCDAVCRNKPEDFAERVREVGGFPLNNVPRAPVLAAPPLPPLIPVLFHGNKRTVAFEAAETVCLPFYRVIDGRNGKCRHEDRMKLAETFGISPGTRLVLTGTDIDPPLERWWSLGSRRREAIRALCEVGIDLVTTPNYSLFTDQPRWDDLHSMKRIAIVHQEFLSEGMPAALHVNARTDRDWERWREYVAARPEVTHIAFEFGTGAGWGERMGWHATQLAQLARAVNRPLHLVVRGGGRALPQLLSAFSKVTLLETSAFVKTVRRQRAVPTAAGALRWHRSPTAKSESLDRLLAENWPVVAASYERFLKREAAPRQAA